ncbi:hypothetical protein HWV62_34383 [Athelia sp. TMB]|nr:hypothetical protein HWV62_34383 [Athelia sp. TMB]
MTPQQAQAAQDDDEYWRGLENDEQSSYWESENDNDHSDGDEPVRTPHRRQAVPAPSTPRRRHGAQQVSSDLRDSSLIEIKVPAWITEFADISLNISPRRSSARAGGLFQSTVTPVVVPPRGQGGRGDRSESNLPSPPASPRTRPAVNPPRQDYPRVTVSTPGPSRLNPPAPSQNPTLSLAPAHQTVAAPPMPTTRPRPIFPVQPGEPTPAPRTFDEYRTHGYYIIFKGAIIGVFNEYWADVKPYIRKGQGGSWRKRETLEEAIALWKDASISKRVIP